MARSKKQLLWMCRGFFLQTTVLIAISICGCFYGYHVYKIFGLTIMIIAALGRLPYFLRNTYAFLDDIFKKNIDLFEGKIGRIEYSRIRDVLPCGIFISNTKKEREKSGTYHLNVKIRARVGSWVKIRYLKKSRIIIEYEVIKY